MILDHIANAKKHEKLHPLFSQAFDFLRRADLVDLAEGKHPILGEQLYASVDIMNGRGRDGARLEAHRKYIDIQYTVSGSETIGWKNARECRVPSGAFQQERDVLFYHDKPESWFSVPSGHFAIFYPEDAHAPLGGCGRELRLH